MLVPAFTGWGTPHWDPGARGLLIGLTRDTGRGQIARAALEGIALSVAGLVQLAEQATGQGLGELAVDGGAAASDPLLQAQADSTGLKVRRPSYLQSTARGVALLAGVQAGEISSLQDLESLHGEQVDIFSPSLSSEQRQTWLMHWNDAISRSLRWHE